MEDIEKFWSKVDRSTGPDSCWEWLGGRNEQGYGVFYPRRSTKKPAHRWLLGHLRGRPLDPKRGVEDACHHCDNPPCCNPRHLYVGTRKQNIADAIARGRFWQQKIGACPAGHPYEGANLSVKPTGARRCKACAREQDRVRRANRSECKNGHPLIGPDILRNSRGRRVCPACEIKRVEAVRTYNRQRTAVANEEAQAA